MADQVSIDPSLWSIDEVIDQVCQSTSSLHANLQVKPVLDLTNLETALRNNDIDGETLLALEDVNVKDDLGIASFGQRREIRKILLHLRNTSPIYATASETPKRSRTSEDDKSSASYSPEVGPQPKKRRVQPETISSLPLNQPQDFNPDALEPHWQAFLTKHREDTDEEILRPYAESDAEKELDSDDSLFDDLHSEKDLPGPRLSQEQVDQAIEEAVHDYEAFWLAQKRSQKFQAASRRWFQAAKAGTRKPQQNSLQTQLKQYQSRYEKFRRAIADPSMDFHSVEEVKRSCMNLQATVEDIAERKYYLEVLENDTPPTQPIVEQSGVDIEGSQDLPSDEEILDSSTSGEEYASDEEDTPDANEMELSEDESNMSLPYDLADPDWNPILPAPEIERSVSAPNFANMEDTEALGSLAASAGSSPAPAVGLDRSYQTPSLDRDLSPAQIPEFAEETTMAQPQHDYSMDVDEEPDLDRHRLPQGRYRNLGTTTDNAISLSSSVSGSENSFQVCTPPLNPLTPTKTKIEQHYPTLKYPDIQLTRAKKWAELGNDPFHILCKIVYRHDRSIAKYVLDYCSNLPVGDSGEHLRKLIAEMDDEEENPSDINIGLTYALFFVNFVCAKGYRDLWDVPEAQIDDAYERTQTNAVEFDRLLKPLLRWYIDTKSTNTWGATGPNKMGASFATTSDLSNHGLKHRRSISNTPVTDLESDFEEDIIQGKKRQVEQNLEALSSQRDARSRVRQEEARREILMARLQQASSETSRVVPVNTEEPIIYLDPHIARRVKDHQIEGIQFLWRELVTDPKHQGCLLAHTMGLGKTMQVISFLVTLAQAKSDTRYKHLIPSVLHGDKILVICPASLVDNWYDELLMWVPPDDPGLLGNVFKAPNSRSLKLRMLQEWDAGILIISYESFKSLLNKARYKGNEQEYEAATKSLLEDPSIVIGDEAHKLKNAKSAANIVAQLIETKSRVALTGSPLNNHLEEYHTMIDWVAPGYLGTVQQFRSKYSEPIERGLYADSSKYDKRQSIKKLHVLKKDIDPKIHRKDISAIAEDMPQKTEFFITVPLTDVQKQIYTIMVQHILRSLGSPDGEQSVKSSNAQLWSWLAILSWLCNHPSCLIRKLQERDPEGYIRDMAAADEEDTILPDNIDLRGSEVEKLLPHFLDVLKTAGAFENLEDSYLSYRSLVTQQLVEESIAQGEKILIFSHSIPTLDFLEGVLHKTNTPFLRIDGSTRTDRRQDATKEFNSGNEHMVFLISTRAGGLGLNLQGANRVVIYDFGFNPSWEEQAIGRAYRLGQKKPVFVYRFRAGGTFEEAMYNKSIFKTQLFSRVVDQKNVVRHASKRIEDYLFIPKDVEQNDLSECLGKDALLDKLIEQSPGVVRDLILTETFQREDEDDVLTKEERDAADEEVRMEQLRRNNPEAYALAALELRKKQAERPQQELAPSSFATPSQLLGGMNTLFEGIWKPPTGSQLPMRPAEEGTKDDANEMDRD